MCITFKHNPPGDVPSFPDEFYIRANESYEREKGQRLRELCEERHWDYDPSRIMCILRDRKAELYYYHTEIGTLEPLIALAPLEVTFAESASDLSTKVKFQQQEIHPDIFKPRPDPFLDRKSG